MTDIDTLAKAVRDQLNVAASQGAFVPAFTVEIDDKPQFDSVKALETLTVTMLPPGVELSEQTRGHDKQMSTLQIGFMQHAERPAASGIDGITAMTERLRKLEQSVMTWLSHRPRRIPITGGPKLFGIKCKPLYDAETLRTQRTFIGVIELTYEETARLA